MTDARIFDGLTWQSLIGPPGPVTVVPAPTPTPTPVAPAPIPSGQSTDALPALQALVDAGQAVTDGDMTAGWTVRIPQAAQSSYTSGPLYIDGRNITLAGDGTGSRIAGGYGGYGGPAVVLGVSRLERLGLKPTDYRVPSVLGPGRLAISTRGTAVLSVTGHPLQLGGNVDAGSLIPDYWQSPAYTFEFVVGPSAGATWGSTVPLFGLSPATGGSWGVYSGQDMTSISLFVRRASQAPTTWDTFTIPTPGPWPHAVTAQWDSATATVTAWVDGKAVTVTSASNGGPAWVAGDLMARGTGDTPFLFGGVPPYLAGVDVHGFIVSIGKKYDPTKATETRLDGLPITPSRYWDRPVAATATVPAPATTVAFLPMDDVPATHVPIDTGGGGGVGFWIPYDAKGMPVGAISGNLALKDLSVSARTQQAIACGQCYGLTMTDVVATGGLQGFGSIPIGNAYPAVFTRCTFTGVDASFYGYRQIARLYNTVFPQVGTDAARVQGGDYVLRDSFSTFHSPATRTYVTQLGDAYGGLLEVDGFQIDNEDGSQLVAVVDVIQSPYCPNRVIVRRIVTSTMNATARYLRTTGCRTAASGNTFAVGLIEVSELICFSGFGGVAVEILGGIGSYYGTADLRNLGGTVTGQSQDITVIQTPVTTPAQ